MGMPHKSGFDIIAVWIMTGIGNVIAYFGLAEYLPIVRDVLSIVSIAAALGYTLYKWRKDWNGSNPKKKK